MVTVPALPAAPPLPAGLPAGLRAGRELIGAMPAVSAVLARLGFDAIVAAGLGEPGPRRGIAPATVTGVLVRNLAVGREPLYALAEWAAGYEPALLGLQAGQAALLNDDRAGRALDDLYAADRATMITRLSLAAAAAYGICAEELHNDSTSLALYGAYLPRAGEEPDGPPGPPRPARGHSKDHRPDLKQLVAILTTSADGAVPFTFKMADGNTEDTATHIATWDACRRIAGRPGFLYVADSKLATARNMAHIDREHGRFLSLLPRSRREDRQGRDWIAAGGAGWTLIASSPGRRTHDPPATWHAAAAPAPSAEGYQITWIRSSAKQATDAASRADRIARATASLDALATRLDAPRCKLKTTQAVTAAAGKIITAAAAGRWVSCTVTSHDTVTRRQIGAGRPGPATRYTAITRTRCALTPATDTALAARDAASDGCFPLITNDHTLTPAQILAAYKHQPRIERRHATFKGILHAAPLELKNDTRIDALCFCLYTALLVHALTEREVRAAMTRAGLPELPLYHEGRPCAAPSAARILEILAPLAITTIYHDGDPVTVIPPALTPLQEQLITMLGVPPSAYHQQPEK